jgi:hypothetical protein
MVARRGIIIVSLIATLAIIGLVSGFPQGTQPVAANDQSVDIDVSVNGGDYLDPDDFAGRDINACPGAVVDIRFTAGPLITTPQTLKIRFQPLPRMEYVGEIASTPDPDGNADNSARYRSAGHGGRQQHHAALQPALRPQRGWWRYHGRGWHGQRCSVGVLPDADPRPD